MAKVRKAAGAVDPAAMVLLTDLQFGLNTPDQCDVIRRILQDRLTELGPTPIEDVSTVPNWFRLAWMRAWRGLRAAWRKQMREARWEGAYTRNHEPALGFGNQSCRDTYHDLSQHLGSFWDHAGTTMLCGRKCLVTEPYAEPAEVASAVSEVASLIGRPWAWAVVQPGVWHLRTVRGIIFPLEGEG